jgi:hypothetical protein
LHFVGRESGVFAIVDEFPFDRVGYFLVELDSETRNSQRGKFFDVDHVKALLGIYLTEPKKYCQGPPTIFPVRFSKELGAVSIAQMPLSQDEDLNFALSPFPIVIIVFSIKRALLLKV